MGNHFEGTEGRSFEAGRVMVYVTEDGSLDRVIVHPTGQPFEVLLTLDLGETKALFRVLEHVFGHWDERPPYPPPRQLWEGTKFHYLAPLLDRPDIFWISVGAINIYVRAAHMEIVFNDLKAALGQSGLAI